MGPKKTMTKITGKSTLFTRLEERISSTTLAPSSKIILKTESEIKKKIEELNCGHQAGFEYAASS